MGKQLWNKKLGRDGYRCRSQAPLPQPFPMSSSLGISRILLLQEETTKPLSQRCEVQQWHTPDLGSACGLCPLPQAVSCWVKEHRRCQRSFHIDFPHKGRMMSTESTHSQKKQPAAALSIQLKSESLKLAERMRLSPRVG